jgi:RNA polymerase sigma-70 factor (ECF subfamily)
MLQAIDDSELVRQALHGDREAFARLVERHYALIYRVAYRYVGSPADAEDVAQDICIALATKLDRFRGRSRFSTWLVSIVINRCRDFLRRRRSSEKLMERYGVLRKLEEDEHDDAEERSSWLHETLQRLEPSLRETALLVVGEDFSHAEAAEILGCAETTVSWRMHVVKKRLRALTDKNDE